MQSNVRVRGRWAALLAVFALVGAACAAEDAGEFADEAVETAELSDDTRLTAAAGAGLPHYNVQPSLGMNCIIAVQGSYPSRPTTSLRSGLASTTGGGEPMLLAGFEPMLGEVAWVPYKFVPRGWAACDGASLMISVHTALFSLLGTTYGGDGRTTFALPDVRGRAVVHAGAGVGLTPRSLGEQFGSETATAPLTVHSHVYDTTEYPTEECRERDEGQEPQPCTGQPLVSYTVGDEVAHNNVQPSIALNCIIALGGTYPSRSFRAQIDTAVIGEIRWVALDFAPIGWAFCDGQSLLIANFVDLFSLLGTAFGGDGRTTFELPDARGRTFVHWGVGPGLRQQWFGTEHGNETETLLDNQLASHSHGWEFEPSESPTTSNYALPHNNVQPSLNLTCLISFQGIFPSRNFRHGFSSSTETGEHTALLSVEPLVGEIMWVPYDFAPRGWAFCAGNLMDTRENEVLFALTGVTFGGDGRTTFALPDVRGRTLVGAGQGDDLTLSSLGAQFGFEQVTPLPDEVTPHDHYTP